MKALLTFPFFPFFVAFYINSCMATSGCTEIGGGTLCFDFSAWTWTCEAYWGDFSNRCSVCTVCDDSTFGYSCELQVDDPCSNECVNRSCEKNCIGALHSDCDPPAVPVPAPLPTPVTAAELPTSTPNSGFFYSETLTYVAVGALGILVCVT